MSQLTDLQKQVLDVKVSTLRDYIIDLEHEIKERETLLCEAEKIELGAASLSATHLAVVQGINDFAHRQRLAYLKRELVQAKYEFQIAAAELLGLDAPASRQANIDRIKSIPIRDFISRYTIINKADIALCPIHREKTPSLHIYSTTNSWFCFGHNSGGSIIDFVMQLEECDLKTALEYLSKLITEL